VEFRDSDFCVHYAGLNPNLYAVWACPCGYAATETTFDLPSYQRETIKQALAGRELPPGVNEDRTPEVAIVLFEQAIYLAGVRKLSLSNVAGLHLKLSWIYRELGDQEREREQLILARDKYLQAYGTERLGGEGKMSETSVAYLIGELHRRTGEFKEAINWLSRLASDPRTQREPNVLNLARDGWQLARTQLKAEAEGASPAPSADRTAAPAPPPAGGSSLAGRLAAARAAAEAGAEAGAAGNSSPVAALASGRLRLPSRDRTRASRITTNVSLYTDQVEWLRRVVAACDDQGGNLAIPEIIRAVLDVAVGNLPPEGLAARDEEGLRQQLITLLDRKE
jgi:uncharacterized protein (DUF2225 family)